MFCTSLRRRRVWETVPAMLLSSQRLEWQETSIETHDLAVALSSHDYFRLLLVSCVDLEQLVDLLARIERFYHQMGGHNIAIVFLLNEDDNAQRGTLQMMSLQTQLLPSLDVPVLPLNCLGSLEATILSFQRQLITARTASSDARPNPVISLLPYCTTKPPLPEHTRNILSDTFHSISELAEAALTVDGQEGLRQLMSEPRMGSADDVCDFWKLEYVVD